VPACQREVELADVQAHGVDARATADAFLQATRAAEDHATRAKRTAALVELEVGFLKTINVRSPLDYSLSLSPLGSRFICHEQTSYASEEAVQGPGYIDQAKEQHIKELESLVSKYKAHIAHSTRSPRACKWPVLDQGSGLGLQAFREELASEKHALQEAHRGAYHVVFSLYHHGKINTFFLLSLFLWRWNARREGRSKAEGQRKDPRARADSL